MVDSEVLGNELLRIYLGPMGREIRNTGETSKKDAHK
jgi:hypothetical protein